jgi:hypothetical protein
MFQNFFTSKKNLLGINGKTVLVTGLQNWYSMELSIDWIHDLVYFNEYDRIILFNMNHPEYRFTVISEKGNKINHISVNPLDSFIIYCVYDHRGKIMKALQDGSNQTLLIEEINSYPISLTIDLSSRKIFWIDLFLAKLSSVDFEGNNYQTILKSEELFSEKNFMGIFGEDIYLSKSLDHSIFKINKFDPNGPKNYFFKLTKDTDLHSMKIIHSSLQPNSTNRCINHYCSHLCVPIGLNRYRCVCPQVLIHRNNGTNICFESVSA